MSAVLERPVDFGAIGAGAGENSVANKIKQASAVRWVWQPFRDIPLFDTNGPAFRNNLTLRTKTAELHGKYGLREESISDPVTELRRCQPYPLTNCEYEVSLHERKRYGMGGEELAENDLPGTYAGPTPTDGAPAHAVESKFAYTCARELSEQYAATHGLVVLESLTGNEDSAAVKQVFELVQPFTYPLHKLERELAEGAKDRIAKSKASTEIKRLAEGCRELMLRGCRKALATATEHMGDYSRQVQLAGAGQKGNRAFPSPYEDFLGEQLGVEVPRVVRTEKTANTNDELLARLAERELARGGENDALNRALAQLEEERAARKALEARVDALAKQKAV